MTDETLGVKSKVTNIDKKKIADLDNNYGETIFESFVRFADYLWSNPYSRLFWEEGEIIIGFTHAWAIGGVIHLQGDQELIQYQAMSILEFNPDGY